MEGAARYVQLRPATALGEKTILRVDNHHGSRAIFVIVRHVVDAAADGEAPHLAGIVGLQQFRDNLHVGHAGIEPQIVALAVEDHRHSVVDGCSNGIRHCGQNRARLDLLPLSVFPPVPQSREREQLAIIHFKTERLFGCESSFPLIETVTGDQAPAEFQMIAESRLLGGCFRPCVDRACSARGVFSPMRHLAPLHKGKLTNRFLGMLANHRSELSGGDVISRRPVLLPIGSLEVFLDDLLSSGQSVASAHGKELSQIHLNRLNSHYLGMGLLLFEDEDRLRPAALVNTPCVWRS
jgi:hypothetical protein